MTVSDFVMLAKLIIKLDLLPDSQIPELKLTYDAILHRYYEQQAKTIEEEVDFFLI